MKYVNRSRSEPNAFVGFLNDNDESKNVVVTLLVKDQGPDELPEPDIIEVGDQVFESFKREARTANQISDEHDSHRYTVLDSNNRPSGTLYISRPQDPSREIYAVLYPPRGADTAEALSRVERLKARKANRDPNDPMPF